ncbi:MAG: prepilin-type N-terminal cleavage/methylation domain-containing protein [Chloroflexi bacterium]|nr:prepilin-type N-terminal cleavage/methylation domain-containing protein [Chloroflexota bacterium]
MNQKGFTLIELLLAMAVGAMIMTGIVLAIFQVSWGTDRSNSQVVALADVAQAAHRIKKDLIMAQSTDLIDGNPVPQSSISLTWIDYTLFTSSSATAHASSYLLSGTLLQRTYDGTVSIVGRNITSLGFTQNGRVINVAITATGPKIQQRQETLQFSVHMRPEEVTQ